MRQHKPITYQVIDGARREVESRYVLADNAQVGFEVGAYDATQPLVIDPVLTYSSYFGSLSEEGISDIAVDAAGFIYVTGRTEDAPQFPVTPGAFQTTKPGNLDAFVSKFNAAGTALIYSTFLGGTQNEDGSEHMNRLAIDAQGAVYVTGITLSADFPITPATADDPTFEGDVPTGNRDGYYTKLNPAGGLEYSTFIGGNKSEITTGIAVDSNGNVYISGGTSSTPADGFELTADAWDSTFAGSREAFLLKFNAAGQKVYATYIGGSSAEQTADLMGGLAIDNTGKAYVVSDTYSNDLTILNGAQATNVGGQPDGFLVVIDTTKPNAAGLVYSTYMGGANVDAAYAVAYAGNGQVVVVGDAREGFPTKNALDATWNGGIKDIFIAKYDTTLIGADSLLFSTFLGGTFRERRTTSPSIRPAPSTSSATPRRPSSRSCRRSSRRCGRRSPSSSS